MKHLAPQSRAAVEIISSDSTGVTRQFCRGLEGIAAFLRYAVPLDDDDDESDYEYTSEVHYSVISYFISLSPEFGVYLEVDARDF